jgi:sugar phosphate isomerase/epimerase
MRVAGGDLHLAYCTNIHPGSGWPEVLGNLRQHVPELKRRLSPTAPFGLGLRLSAQEAREVLEPAAEEELTGFLAENDCYVALLNGFVHGDFHRRPVKDRAFAPDWTRAERVEYTGLMARVLGRLLPDGLDGGISTVPLSYRPWTAGRPAWPALAANLALAVEPLVRLAAERGRLIHLDLEPEPDGLVECADQLIAFFDEWLLPVGGRLLGSRLGMERGHAEELLLEHVRVCLDCCHLAVRYEDPARAWERLARAGIRVGRVQVSSALEVDVPARPDPAAELRRELEPFADSVYLHQVVEEGPGGRRRFADLPEALDRLETEPAAAGTRWRVHFHVPLFVTGHGPFRSTQAAAASALAMAVERGECAHLELETYTWDVLPPELKGDLVDSICREYRWVLARIG